MKPSPFIASTQPSLQFDPECHVAFGDLFVARNMSPLQDSLDAITKGAGLPDRADQGWLALRGASVLTFIRQIVQADGVMLVEGEGLCATYLNLGDITTDKVDVFVGEGVVWIGAGRLAIPDLLPLLCQWAAQQEVAVEDLTQDTVRIAVMGPDSLKLLYAMELPPNSLGKPGQHMWIEVIQEPVLVCRSDFAGPDGYEFIIPSEPFNMILAVICSWGVRLGLNLLPVGLEPIQQLRRAGQPLN